MARGAAADAAPNNIPVLHPTGGGDFEKQREAPSDGATGYMVKPFTPSDLAAMVSDTLDPHKREEMKKGRAQKSAQLRAITDIMHRDRK